MISPMEQSLFQLISSRSSSLSTSSHSSSWSWSSSTSSSSTSSSRIPFLMLIVTFIFLIVSSELRVVSSNPVPSSSPTKSGHLTSGNGKVSESRECFPGSELRDLCEMCAKVTRNVNTFPWCCTHQFNVTNWCEEYLSYTIGPNK